MKKTNSFTWETLIFLILMIFSSCSSNKEESKKEFPPISLINKIEFYDSAKDWDKIGCGFLLKYGTDTLVVSAKHIISVVKTDSMKYLTLDGFVKKWSLRPLTREDQSVVVNKLLNADNKESLNAKNRFENDWLVFSIRENNSKVKPLEMRETPLIKGEKLYVVGWTRTMTEGAQRVYEFKYYKTKGTHILLKNIIVPEKFGGLSGAPVIDENGMLVGIVSNSTFEILAVSKLFSPCKVENLKIFLNNYYYGKQESYLH